MSGDKNDYTQTHLGELRPDEVNDQTQYIDKRMLRAAKKEAAKMKKLMKRAERKDPIAAAQTRARLISRLLMVLGIPVVLAGGAYASLAMGLISPDIFGPQISSVIKPLISPIPGYSDLDPGALAGLRRVAAATENAPEIFAVQSRVSTNKPVFYVATNLSDGFQIDFRLSGKPGTLIPDKNAEVRFPLVTKNHHFKTAALTTSDGSPLPKGEYLLTITEGDEQLPKIKERLDSIAPGKDGKKIHYTASFFIGGERDAAYLAEVKNNLERLRRDVQTELSAAQNSLTALDAKLNETISAWNRLTRSKPGKVARTKAQREWSAFHMKWPDGLGKADMKAVFYPDLLRRLEEVRTLVAKVHAAQTHAAGVNVFSSADKTQVEKVTAEARSRISTVRSTIITLSAEALSPEFRPHRQNEGK